MTKPKRKSKEAALEATKPPITIIEACQDPDVFGPWFKDRLTWVAWFVFLRVMFGLGLDDAELAIFQECTSRTAPRPGGYLEATLVVCRRGGKSLILALIAAFLSAFYDWSPYLTGGERGTIMIIATDRRQAATIFKYLRGMLGIPLLAGMIQREPAKSESISWEDNDDRQAHTRHVSRRSRRNPQGIEAPAATGTRGDGQARVRDDGT